MNKVVCITFCLLLCCSATRAQTVVSDSLLDALEQQTIEQHTVPDDTNEEAISDEASYPDTLLHITSISISPDTVNNWKHKPEFAYMKNLDSLLRASEEDVQEEKPYQDSEPSFINQVFSNAVLKAILWVIAAAFVVLILVQLYNNKVFFKSSNRLAAVEEDALPADEDLQSEGYDLLLQKAISVKDYRLAVRYYFLKTLKKLNDQELIHFSREKTNSRYVQELPVTLRNPFSRLLLNYEYVWYGKFPLSETQFDHIAQEFGQFNKAN